MRLIANYLSIYHKKTKLKYVEKLTTVIVILQNKQLAMLQYIIIVHSPLPPHAQTTLSFACWLPNTSWETPAALQQALRLVLEKLKYYSKVYISRWTTHQNMCLLFYFAAKPRMKQKIYVYNTVLCVKDFTSTVYMVIE